MINIGTLELTDAYVGSTPIEKAYIDSTLVWEKSSPLPYDAEVMYLESTGTQYIDTGISPTANTEVTIKLMFNSFTTSSILCGARTGTTNNNRFFPFAHSANGVIRCTYGTTQYTSNISYQFVYNVVFNETSTHKCFINGKNLGTLSGYTKSTSDNLILFGTSGYGNSHYLGSGKIYSCQIRENGVLVRDFIPVREGQVGYMYDKVSESKFYNIGTGSFTCGHDKNVMPYDAEVEYLQSSGTQYINIPLYAFSGKYFSFEGKIKPIYNNTSKYGIFSATPDVQFESNFYSYDSSTGKVGYSSSVGNSTTSGGWAVTTGQINDFKLSTTGKITNGAWVDVSRPLTSDITTFRLYSLTSSTNRYPVAFGRTKIITGDITAYEFIPVRKNGVGYLYDKVSGVLFGNNGTGAFTLGPDVT